MPSPFYRHSGKVPATAAVALPITSFFFAIIAGSVFGYLEFLAHLLPAIKLMIVAIGAALFGFGVALGFVPARLGRRLNSRSISFLFFITFVESCIAMYFAWIFWIVAYLNYLHAPVHLRLADPIVLWHYISVINQHGSWSFGFDDRPTGLFLTTLWAAEVVVVFVAALAFAKKVCVEKVFCEQCGKWGVQRSLMQIRPIDTDTLRSTVLAGNFDLLTKAERSAPGEDSWNDITLEGCATCDSLQTLTILRSNRIRNGRKTEIKQRKILHRLLISPDQTVDLAQIAATVTSANRDSGEA